VQLLNNNGNVLRNLTTNAILEQLSNLVPSTNYTIAIKAMDSAGIGMTKKDKFATAIIPHTGMCVLACECMLLNHASSYSPYGKMKPLMLHGVVMRQTSVEFMPTGQLYVC